MLGPTEAQTRQWDEDGYLVFSDAIAGQELRRLQNAFEHWAEQCKADWLDLPAAWLVTFESDEKRVEYAAMHLLGDVPAELSGFKSFYSARKDRFKSKIRDLLG